MLRSVLDAMLVGSLAPGALWLGTRYEHWMQRRGSRDGRPSASGRREIPTSDATKRGAGGLGWSTAALVRVAVIDDELLVELAPISATGSLVPGSEVMWLCGRVDRAQIAAAVARCRSSDPVHILEAEPDRVVLDVGEVTIPLVRLSNDGGTGSQADHGPREQ